MSDEPHSPRNPERLPGRDSIRVASAAAQDQPAPRARLLVDLPTRVIYAIAPPDRNLRSIRIRNRGWWAGRESKTPSFAAALTPIALGARFWELAAIATQHPIHCVRRLAREGGRHSHVDLERGARAWVAEQRHRYRRGHFLRAG